MKNSFLKSVFFFLSFTIIISCYSEKENSQTKEGKIIAKIDSISITQKEVDYFVKQKLYDELSRIYLIRKISLDKIIENKIIESQAKSKELTSDEILQELYQKKVNKNSIKKFIEDNEYDKNGINTIENGLKNYNVNSGKGKELIIEKLKLQVISKFVDSIKKKSNLQIFLTSPLPPKVTIDKSLIHYKVNKRKSKITFIEISDFECSKCKEYRPIFKSLYEKYKDDVSFGFVNFGSYVSMPVIASEAAALQGKFWEMKEMLFETEDHSTYESIALKLGLDMLKFKNDVADINLINKIKQNYKKIHDSGIYGTPTILINHRIMNNSSSIEELESFLKNEIRKNK